ncbi:MAG: DUF2946 family protein [Pseudomonadota bacterium]
MDNIVLQAMMRWPNVPSVYGWLQLDRRGRWLIKDEPITNPTVNAFINRNYLCNEAGQWYFQNGPQRVLVTLEHTPYIYRIWRDSNAHFLSETHTGLAINQPSSCWLDDSGCLLLACEHGIGCVETQSLAVLASAFCDLKGMPLSDSTVELLLEGNPVAIQSSRLRWGTKLLPLGFLSFIEVPERFHFERSPQPLPGQPPC